MPVTAKCISLPATIQSREICALFQVRENDYANPFESFVAVPRYIFRSFENYVITYAIDTPFFRLSFLSLTALKNTQYDYITIKRADVAKH